MNRFGISGRIAIIIVLVAIATAVISAGTSFYINKNRFSDFLSSTDQKFVERLSSKAVDYYKVHGTLEGLQASFKPPHPPSWEGGEPPEPLGPPMGPQEPRIDQRRPDFHFQLRYVVTATDGTVVADSLGSELGKNWKTKQTTLTRYPLELENGRLIGHIYLGGLPLNRMSRLEDDFIAQIQIQTGMAGLIAAIFALLLGVFLTRRIVSPVTELTNGIHQLARGDLGVRIRPHGDKELYLLGSEFNLMAQRLQDTEENRRSFLANIAHEIRTPLTILRGELEAIQEGRIQASEEIVSSLVDEIIRLTRLVKDFETLSMAEGGGLRLSKLDLTVEAILESLLPLRLLMEQDEIEFIVDVNPDVHAIYADSHRLTQILINLFTNAIKNTGGGGKINLGIRQTEAGIEFSIRNNGPGILAEDLLHVFERFFQSDRNGNRHSGGTGLGLAIARSYVEAHGGRIWAESKVDEETCFYFVLPHQGNNKDVKS